MIDFPSAQSRIWKSESSEIFGNIARSKNLNFNNKGVLEVAKKATVLYSATDDSHLNLPVVIAGDSSVVYVITSNSSYTFDPTDSTLTFTEIPTSGNPTYGRSSDAVFYNGSLIVSGTTTAAKYSGGPAGSWSAGVTSLNPSYPHPLCVSEHQSYLAVGNGNKVNLYSSGLGASPTTTLTLDSQFIVTGIRWRQNNLYIATRNPGGEAKLFVWNGSGTAVQYGFGVQADWIYSMCEYKSSIVLITSAGQLLRYSGGGFEVLAELPVAKTDYPWTSDAATASLIGKVANRGMQARGDRIYINLNGSLDLNGQEAPGPVYINQPSGLWTFDSDTGLTHKAGYNYTSKISLTPTAVASNYLVFSQNHGLSTGDPVLATSVSGITGITAGTPYYVVVDQLKTFKLALSPADAFAGRPMAISGIPTTDKIVFDSFQSLGSTYVTDAGALFLPGKPRINNFYGSEVLFGGRAKNESLVSAGVLMSLGLSRNKGYFVTAKIFSPSVINSWKKLGLILKNLNLSTDKIRVKWRNSQRFGLPNPYSVLTWTSATTFTVDTLLYDVKSIAVGDEIEVTAGANAGYIAHITAIDTSSSTYSYTIDETFPAISGTANFFVENWQKAPYITSSSEGVREGHAESGTEGTAAWVEFKVEIEGVGTGLYQGQVI